MEKKKLLLNSKGKALLTEDGKILIAPPNSQEILTKYININANGTYDVREYGYANVNVPIPEGYLKPQGTLTIKDEGTYDVSQYASVNLDIETEQIVVDPSDKEQTFEPSASKYFDKVVVKAFPEGLIIPYGTIDITTTEEVDVGAYKTAKVVEPNLKPENIAKDVNILGIVGTFKGGIDTSNATATANDILLGKTAYVGEGKVEGTIETYDYEGVGGSDTSNEDLIITRSSELTTYRNDRITYLGSYAFAGSKLESVDLPNVEEIGNSAFNFMSTLTNINAPKVKKLGMTCFQSAKFVEINFPALEEIGSNAFNSCKPLITAIVPNLKKMGNSTFNSNGRLKKVLIEQTDIVCVAGSTCFGSCYHILGTVNSTYNPNGDKDGYIQVPASRLAEYKVATNWVEIASQIIGHQDFNVGDTLPDYTTTDFTTQTWYSDETLTTVVTSVATAGKYYCRLEA